MPLDHVGGAQGGHRGQIQGGLGDEAAGVGPDAVRIGCDLRLRGLGADEHAVAAGAMHLLGHQLAEVLQHIGQPLLGAALPGGDVGQDGFLAEVEADHLRDVDIDRLVIGDAGAGRGAEGDATGAVGVEEARHTQQAVRSEGQGIQVVVIDAAVDDVHHLGARRGLLPDPAILHEEVHGLHQLDTHEVRQEAVLVVGGVERARRQQDHHRVPRAGRRGNFLEGAQQLRGVVVHGHHPTAVEELREHAGHDLPVLQHVGDAGRRAAVVLQYLEGVGPGAHDVDADDVAVDPARGIEADHLRSEGLVLIHQILGD